MPERTKAVGALVSALCGEVVYDNRDYRVRVNGRWLKDRDRWWKRYDKAYEAVVERIDWNRVMLEGVSCHIARQQLNPAHKCLDYDDELCPDCLREALLAGATWIDWRTRAKYLEQGR